MTPELVMEIPKGAAPCTACGRVYTNGYPPDGRIKVPRSGLARKLDASLGFYVLACKACGHVMAYGPGAFRDLTPAEAARLEADPSFVELRASIEERIRELAG